MTYETKSLSEEDIELLKRQGLEAAMRNQLNPFCTLIDLVEEYFNQEGKMNKEEIKPFILGLLPTAKDSIQMIINQTGYWENSISGN